MSEPIKAGKQTSIPRVWTLLEKVLYRLGLRTPPKLNAAVEDFVTTNSRYWTSAQTTPQGRVLIEGHLAEYGSNYLFRTAIAAKALQEVGAFQIDVVFNGFRNRWRTATRVYKSFHITNFIFLGRDYFLRNIGRGIASWLFTRRLLRTIRQPTDILTIKYEGIKVGDLIYDDVLKKCGMRTIDRIDRRVKRRIWKSYYYFLQYKALFRRGHYKCYIATHTTYSEYGILCRVALAYGANVLETTDIQMSLHENITDERLPTYHDGIRCEILKALNDPESNMDERYVAAERALRKRLNSQIKQLDTDKAFRGRTYTRSELCAELGVDNAKKVAFIAAHVFSDSPHLSSGMLHADYFKWLQATLTICTQVPEVIWLVKPHPASDFYGEQGVAERMIRELDAPNVLLCPRDLNTRSLEVCADAVVTVHGTAGLEFSCVGIPVVVAGRPFYSRLGFTIDPETLPDYERALIALKDIEPLSADKRRLALRVFGIWERLFDWNNPIITADVLANVWGDERPRDLAAAYAIMASNLRSQDPRSIRLWNFAQATIHAS